MNVRWSAMFLTLVLAASARGDDPYQEFEDASDDAVIRRTDPGADGPLNPNQVLPELLSCRLSKWESPTPATDPFNGSVVQFGPPHLFRIDLEFEGLLNPPGPLEISGEHDPFRFGPSPLYGFLEINIDRDRNTGGDPTSEAVERYLANVARFGALPHDSISSRAVTSPGQAINHSWTDSPQFELSGADFTLKLCGCEAPQVIWTSVAGDTVFSAGDTWIVRARFFQRSSGYQPISRINLTGGSCGSPGVYAPMVNLRFSHNVSEDHTTVSLVYALDQIGAGQLAGLASPPPVNLSLECDGNSGSIFEALKDIADAAAVNRQNGSWPSEFARTVAERWAGRSEFLNAFLNPTDWRVTALFGTTYSTTISTPPSEGALYVWTDVGFGCRAGDLDGDGMTGTADLAALQAWIAEHDGGDGDADGSEDGRVTVAGFGTEFDIHDLNNDGVVDSLDIQILTSLIACPGDWNHSGQLTLQDLFDFLSDWFAGFADFNDSGATTLQDLFDYLTAYFNGCP